MVKVKICGIRTVEAAQACRKAAVDLAGLNFVDESRRRIEVEAASALVEQLGEVPAVGLFRDASVADVEKVVARLGLPWIQLHGSERPADYADLAAEVRVLRGFSARGPEAAHLAAWLELGAVPLIDGPRPGSGESFDWSDLAMAGEFYIAGGLDPENVASAIRATGATGVDVASGVEREGRTDPGLVEEFVRNARNETGIRP